MLTVLKKFKTNEFQNGMFLNPSSYYKYRDDNLQHSVVNIITKFNHETQELWHLAPSPFTIQFIHEQLLLGAFNLVY